MNPSGILRDAEQNKIKNKQTKNPEGYGFPLEDTQPDHAISGAVTSTKLTLCCVYLRRKMNKKKEKCKTNYSTFEFLTFWLSYCR